MSKRSHRKFRPFSLPAPSFKECVQAGKQGVSLMTEWYKDVKASVIAFRVVDRRIKELNKEEPNYVSEQEAVVALECPPVEVVQNGALNQEAGETSPSETELSPLPSQGL